MAKSQKNSRNFDSVVSYQVEVTPQGASVVTMPGASFSSTKKGASSDAPSVVASRANVSDGRGSERYVRWDWKKTILDKIEKEPQAAAAIEQKAFALLGQGVGYMRREDLMKGGPVKRHYDPEIEAFLERNQINNDFLQAQAFELTGLFNSFGQLIYNINRTKILQLKHLESEYCAVSRYNVQKKTGDRQYVYYTGEFLRGIKESDFDDPQKCTTLDLYDPCNWTFFQDQIKKKSASFAVQCRIRTPRSFYYATPTHLGLFREKGWVDTNISVPEVVYALQNNQISLKYIIYISKEYFELKMGAQAWLALTPEERQAKFNALRDEIHSKLVGVENVAASLALMCDRDFNGNLRKTIEIEVIDDKMKTGMWVPTADHANAQTVRGFNVPTSMFGLSNSNVKMNSQSGSADRQGFNNMVTLNTPVQKVLLSHLQIMANYNAMNGWKNWDVVFFIDDITHTTINNQETGIEKNDRTTTTITQ